MEGGWGLECAACGLPWTPYSPRPDMTHEMVREILEQQRDRHNRERHGEAG